MSKFLEPRSYVREFNAASMAEAIKLADEALRIEGVTVAVWKNREQALGLWRRFLRTIRTEKLIHDIKHDKIDRILNTMPHLPNMFRMYFWLEASDHFFSKFYYGRPSVSDIPKDRYLYIPSSEILALKSLFQDKISYSIQHEHGAYFSKIHQDGVTRPDPIISSLFNGSPVRAIENISVPSACTAPTAFYKDQSGSEIYILPKGSLGFFISELNHPNSAWHSATTHGKDRRMLQVLDING